jgi:BON domain
MKQLKSVSACFFIVLLVLFLGCTSTPTREGTGEYIDDTVITPNKGVVQLSGFVSSQDDINKAVAVAYEVQGVKSVKNDMRVK